MRKEALQRRLLLICLGAALLTALNACSTNSPTRTGVEEAPLRGDGAPGGAIDFDTIPDAVPRLEPRSRYGNPPSYFQNGKLYKVMTSSAGYVARGVASWYGTKFHGRRTSSGEPYDLYAMTAAHTSLPLPTYVRVTNLRNGRSVVVRVNDRGPFVKDRLIDLSYAAAGKLGILAEGTGLVEVQALDPTAPGITAVATSPPPAPASNLYVQAGAFTNPQNAERLRNRLAQITESGIRISEGYNSDRMRVYRVRIGPIASVEAADRMVEKLNGLGIRTPHLVVD